MFVTVAIFLILYFFLFEYPVLSSPYSDISLLFLLTCSYVSFTMSHVYYVLLLLFLTSYYEEYYQDCLRVIKASG